MTTTRRRLFVLCLAAAAALGFGCALRPDHVTVFCERDAAESAGGSRQRTTTGKCGVSATYDLHP